MANSKYPVEFLNINILIQLNLINAAYQNKIHNFINLGSSCIYPKKAKQPIKEDYLLTGKLEPTNEWYAIAKIAGLKLCDALRKQYNFDAISLMPTNLYGYGDNYDKNTSHVLPAMIRNFWEAKEQSLQSVTCWGTGSPLREFLFVEDLSDAVIFEKIFSFGKKFDQDLDDPVWESVSLKVKKYKSFLNINVFSFKQILRKIINV